MRRTYAPSGILIGVLLGMMAYVKSGSTVLGILAAVVVSVICWVAIRAFEKLLEKGVEKASDAIMNKYEDSKNKH